MYLLALMFGILLLPEASTLRCHECTADALGTCTPTVKECPEQCAAMREVRYADGVKHVDQISKGCAVAEDCVEHSINNGFSQNIITTKCCTTPLCNQDLLPPEPQYKPNGKQCYWCNGRTCTNTLNCEGNEDYCISVNTGLSVIKGCLTKDFSGMCTHGLPYSCCQGNLCNGAISSSSAGLVLLVAPLLSLLVTSY
ncbi:urokinase plasminogen activator surface receptor-like [Perca fluviatilis]|uniref:urokinase plasminogen activator surface receptor-like n=1 Tax=Perca fluviatilis TaxID=8168 RepID=UPI00196363BD|nr:urokinase plasminogen activator surface receptor-like [Perca fluviatilis]